MLYEHQQFRAIGLFVVVLTCMALVPALPASAQDPALLGDDLRLNRCKEPGRYALAVHGGTARKPSTFESDAAFLAQLLEEAGPALAAGASSLDLVHAAVRAMEDSGLSTLR